MKRRNLVKTRKHWWAPRHSSGQAIIEYTILIAAIAAVTAIGTAAFFSRVCRSQNGSQSIFKIYFNRVVNEIGR